MVTSLYLIETFFYQKTEFILKIIIYIKNFLNLIFFILCRLFFRRPKLFDSNRILIINLGQIGDLVLSSIFLNYSSNNHNITLLINKKYKNLFRYYKGKNKIFEINLTHYKYNIFYRIFMLKKIRLHYYTEAINVTTGRSPINDELCLLSGAKIRSRIFTNNGDFIRGFGRFYAVLYDRIVGTNLHNEFEKQTLVFHNIFGANNKTKIQIFFCKSIARHINESIYVNRNIQRYYIALCPHSDLKIKNWGTIKYKKLLQMLLKYTNINIILLGDKKHYKKQNFLRSLNNSRIINIAGKLSIIESAYIVKRAKIFIGNDSGFTHIAKSLGTPFIGLIGGGSYGKFFPYNVSQNDNYFFYKMDCFGCNWVCKYKEPYCLTKIEPQQVFEKVLSMLSKSESPNLSTS